MNKRNDISGISCTSRSESMGVKGDPNCSVGTATLFFHTIHEAELTTLRIPIHFAKQNLQNVDGDVWISTIDSKMWKVKVISDVLGKKFDDGWLSIILHYKIKPSDVLVLFYVGDSLFVLRILDGTTKVDKQIEGLPMGRITPSSEAAKDDKEPVKYSVNSTFPKTRTSIHPLTGVEEEIDPPKYRGDWQTFSLLPADHRENGLVLDLEWGRQHLQPGDNVRILRYRDYIFGPPAHFYKVNCVLEPNVCAIREGWTDFADFYNLTVKDLLAINYVFDDGVTWDVEFYKLNL